MKLKYEAFPYRAAGPYNMYGFDNHLDKYRYLVTEPDQVPHDLQRRRLVLETLEARDYLNRLAAWKEVVDNSL